MSIFKRIQEIISANINELLDKVEDPDTTVRQLIRDMERGIAEMRKHTASVIASQKTTEKRLKRAIEEQESWLKNAETAIRAGDDELAKKALLKRGIASDRENVLRKQLEGEISLVEKLKSELAILEDKIQEARTKRDTLAAKERAMKSRKKLFESTEKWTGAAGTIINGFEAFDKLEDERYTRSSLLEAKEELRKAFEDEQMDETFRKIKKERDVDDELTALKKKMEG